MAGLIDSLLSLGLLIVAAKLAEGLLGRIGVNSIFAYTLVGVLLGPLVADVITVGDDLTTFLGVGIFLLFFLIGLDEIDIPGFVSTLRGRFFIASALSVLISLGASMVVTSDLWGDQLGDFTLGLDFTHALALSGILSLSSLGLVAKVLSDKGLLKEPIGLEIFTTVIISELLALLLVGFTIGEAAHGGGGEAAADAGALSWQRILILLGQIAGFTVVVWALSVKLIPPLVAALHRLLNVPHFAFGMLLGGLFLIVAAAERIGLHGSLGALLFGAALAGLPAHLREEIVPGMRSAAEGLFVPLFFAAAGLSFNLSFFDLPGLTILALLTVPLLGKFAGAFVGAFAVRLDNAYAHSTGLMAKGVAEIALLLVLLNAHIIDEGVFSLLVLIMFGYILLMPQAITFTVNRARRNHHAAPLTSVPPSYARHALQNFTATHFLDRTRAYPGSAVTLQDFASQWTVEGQRDYLVVDDGVVGGIVSTGWQGSDGLPFLRQSRLSSLQLSSVMRHRLPQAVLEEPISDVLQRMSDYSVCVIPVYDREGGQFVGSITSHDVLDMMLLLDEIADEIQQQTPPQPAD